MEWEFSPEQVIKGEVSYHVGDFRRDLQMEVSLNLGRANAQQVDDAFSLLYDFCYWLATGHEREAFISQFCHDPPLSEWLSELIPWMTSNAEMLGAILQRCIMDEVERGAPLEQALQETDHAVRASERGSAAR